MARSGAGRGGAVVPKLCAPGGGQKEHRTRPQLTAANPRRERRGGTDRVLSIWAAFFVSASRLLRRLDGPARERERTIVVGSLAAISGFLVTGLTEWSFGDAEVVLIAWTLAALPFGVALGLEPSSAPTMRPAN